MMKMRDKIFIGFLWIAGAFLLGHAFVPHHHHHSRESAERCLHAKHAHHHDHDHQHHADHQDPFHQHSDNDHSDECGECHLKGDFFLTYGKIIPNIFCNEKEQLHFIPQSIEATQVDIDVIDHYELIFYHSYAHRGPPTKTSSQS